MSYLDEAQVEIVAIDYMRELGYAHIHGPAIAPGELLAERTDYTEVVLKERLRQALVHLNPGIPSGSLDEAFRRVLHPESPSLEANNRAFHEMLIDGVPVEYNRPDGSTAGDHVKLVDFDNPDNNDWLAVNQYTVKEGQHVRRPDIVVFVNGLPLVVIELKNPADEDATIWTAFNQLQTYKSEISSLFVYNAALIISDGTQARIGSLTADREWFMPWRTIEGEDLAPATKLQIEVLVNGVFEKRRFLDYLRHFAVFEDMGGGVLVKKLAGYHQYHAVNKAIEATIQAASAKGDRRCGVVWHTQGSGKSLTMVFYAGKMILHPAMENPTLVLITDRNDLDDQLFGTFSRCRAILRQKPVQARDRDHLKELLNVSSGGVVFTTIQKFFPETKGEEFPMLSDRRNIVVIADEAHRSQYDFIDGFARHMRDALPKASFIGFTGTPIELTDRNTLAVFGDCISIYDILQAVEDRATVPIYYESRLAKLELDEAEKPRIDDDFEEATEGEELEKKERLKTKWAAMESLVGTEKRVNIIADDLVAHFENRFGVMDGKAMVVCMSRRICVGLYNAIVKLRPDWHDENDDKGEVKVVMTGSASDAVDWQQHIRNKPRREALAKRFKDADDQLKVVLVRDMWLTGFDVPCLHTMYIDKPMRGHALMQAIARVNRVFKDKPGGLVVDYLGLAAELKQALAEYTEGGGRGDPVIDQAEAVAIMLEKYEICCDMFHGFDRSAWKTGKPAGRLALLPHAQEHILQQEDGSARFMATVTGLSRAFALAVPHEEAIRIRDDVGFFQAVRAGLAKLTNGGGNGGNGKKKTREEVEQAIRQIVSGALASDGVVDIFAAAGLKKPDISILSDEFLAEVRALPQKNLAVELLKRLLNDDIRTRKRRNLVTARSFAEMLEKTIRLYQNRSIEAAMVIQELIELAKKMREADRRGEDLGLSEEELAFYDALEVNDSAVKVLGDGTLKTIALELVETVRNNTTIDWTLKESVRARLRVMVKRILKKYGYPPDKQPKAIKTVLEQAELLSEQYVA